MTKKVIIIGAGPAGISAACNLVQNKINIEIFEASPFIGGMCRSIDLWGQRVDLGPHRFFSKDDRVNNFFHEILNNEVSLVERQTRIYYKNRFFNYPLSLKNVLLNISIIDIARIIFDYLIIRIKPIKNPSTFEDWVKNKFGSRLFEIFFKKYSEKLWGIPCSNIDADWAVQRIKTFSLGAAIISSIKGNKKNKHKTLVDQFYYPKNGAGSLYEKAAELVISNGGRINLNTVVSKVLIDNSVARGVILKNGKTVNADYVISTMPLTLLVKGIDNIPLDVMKASEKLFFRNTILVYLEINNDKLFLDNWIYIHSPEVRHGRITNFRNWCPSLYKNKKSTILCLEFWAFESDKIWHVNDTFLRELAKKEISKLNLLPVNATILNSFVVKIPKCYPVYEKGYRENLTRIGDYLSTIKNLYPIGRYGAFKYNNQDHSILMGILASQNIIKERNLNLWTINTDTKYQEE